MTWICSRRAFLTGTTGITAWAALGRDAVSQSVIGTTADGFRILRATSVPAAVRVGGAPETAMRGYDGATPGPFLRIKQGDELKIRLVNELAETTAIHWHGIRLPNGMDGVPALTQSPVEPGQSFDYRFKAVDAGTFWYHAPSSLSGQIERGLYGALVVDEKAPVEVDRDVLLVLDGSRAADITTRTNERLRLRLLNPTKARVMRLRFDRHAIRVMGVDGRPAEPFLARDSRIALGPGNRIDVFMDAIHDAGDTASIFLDDAGTETEIARVIYERGEKRRASPPSDPRPFPGNALPERIEMRNALRAEAPLDDNSQARVWTAVAAAPGPLGTPLFSVKRGRAVVMAFPNMSQAGYAVHLHGHHVRLLDNLDDGWKPFWLDTVMIGPRQTARIAFVADNPGKWLIHAQRLEDPNAALTAWFEVT